MFEHTASGCTQLCSLSLSVSWFLFIQITLTQHAGFHGRASAPACVYSIYFMAFCPRRAHVCVCICVNSVLLSIVSLFTVLCTVEAASVFKNVFFFYVWINHWPTFAFGQTKPTSKKNDETMVRFWRVRGARGGARLQSNESRVESIWEIHVFGIHYSMQQWILESPMLRQAQQWRQRI